MSGDVRHFRRRLFGFDTSDVMAYIEELAAQRNKYKLNGDKLESELKSLGEEMRRLQASVDDADRRINDIRINALDQAGGSLSAVRQSYAGIRNEMETTTSTIANELTRLNGSLSVLSSVLDDAGRNFSELQSQVEQEKAEAIAALAAEQSES